MTKGQTIQLGGDRGPYISNYGLMYVDGDTATIRFWDGWPEREIKFRHTDEAEKEAALFHCRQLAAEVDHKRTVAQAEWETQPWWWKLFHRKPQ